MVDNVEYLGAGRGACDPKTDTSLLAHDKTLLAKGKGTNGAFRDGHAEFLPPNLPQKYGITGEPQGVRTMPPKWRSRYGQRQH
jgi:hypothetical protein